MKRDIDATGEEGDGTPGATRIRSVARAVKLVRLAVETPEGVPAELARKHLGVSLATAYHLLNTLAEEGMLAKHDRRYHLGPTAGLIADAYSRQETTPPHLLAPLARLARELGETVTLCLWRNGAVVEVAVLEGSKPLKVGGRTGGLQSDLHARASGKLLLAELGDADLERYIAAHPLVARTPNTITDTDTLRRELDLTRERGWAMEREECDSGVSCIATSVTANQIAGAAAYTIGAPAWRMAENQETYLAALLRAAAEASPDSPPGTSE
ncbi:MULTISPECIES: IclR family transcriptional regulator [unclassified Streptomyces]|uniref:IclR family transcriptional regulator n=1 Tax=unclassified Streptomyces TaxID=2593676 RepID=UPI002E2B11FB|nr:IclR family transcriptional regulator [Streptomyces sp. NBC_00223]